MAGRTVGESQERRRGAQKLRVMTRGDRRTGLVFEFPSSPLLEQADAVQRIEANGLRERIQEQCATNNRRTAIANLIHEPTADPSRKRNLTNASNRSGARRNPIMNKPTRSIEWMVWCGLALVIAAIFGAYVASRLVANRQPPLPVLGSVADFTLTNQLGHVVTLADLRGQVWVADIIFTRCPGACTKMTREMSQLQSFLPPNQPVKFLSLTADPEFDSPEVLRKYAEKFGAAPERWQ